VLQEGRHKVDHCTLKLCSTVIMAMCQLQCDAVRFVQQARLNPGLQECKMPSKYMWSYVHENECGLALEVHYPAAYVMWHTGVGVGMGCCLPREDWNGRESLAFL
jgi:hypothetical protein